MKYLEVQTSTVEGTNRISYECRRLGPRGRRPQSLAGEQFLGRIFTRAAGRDEETTWQTRNAQYDAVVKWGGTELRDVPAAHRDPTVRLHHKR
ncbi:hypothetical protein [Streptomyces milbemycinicus]|uniref:hypothetical protein n=1 Tax=Streptomyces milbemycinicus TaxID=476552 RepID=UPI0033F4C59D